MRKLILILSLIAITPETYADKDRGGGYVTYYSERILNRGILELLMAVHYSAFDPFEKNSEHRAMFIQALEKLEMRPNDMRYRNGRALFMDYDLKSGAIIVLKPYFDRFAITKMNDEDAAMTAQVLAHEAAHLIGIVNDDQAEEYAERLLSAPNKFNFDVRRAIVLDDSFRYRVEHDWTICSIFKELGNLKVDIKDLKSFFAQVHADYCTGETIFFKFDNGHLYKKDISRLDRLNDEIEEFLRQNRKRLPALLTRAIDEVPKGLREWRREMAIYQKDVSGEEK